MSHTWWKLSRRKLKSKILSRSRPSRRPLFEALEDRSLLATFTVINALNSGAGSFRQAITDANSNVGLDTIAFNIAGAGLQTIKPTTSLPTITDAVIIDGYTQPDSHANTLAIGTDASLLIELDGSLAGTAVNGLTITGSGSTVKGLIINNFVGNGSPSVTASTGMGIFVRSSDNVIQGNYLGTDATGALARPNAAGIRVEPLSGGSAMNNTIGGTAPAARNVLSGNSQYGMRLFTTSGNQIAGNYIGVNAAGAASVSTANGDGIWLGPGAHHNTIGGTAPGSRNVISGNALRGVQVSSFTSAIANFNTIAGNYIGLNAAGTVAIANGTGVQVTSGSSDTTIGGTDPAARNVISGNTSFGLTVNSTSRTDILGNYVGTDAAGVIARANSSGIQVSDASNTRVGGAGMGAGNLVIGNNTGVRVEGASSSATVQGNVISGNTSQGVLLRTNASASNNLISGNWIGVDASGVSRPNSNDGVEVAAGTTGGTIVGNVIAFNGSRGVSVATGATGVTIQANSIFSNGSIGIDLDRNGVTVNDLGDADAGANNRQNFPVVSSVTPAGAGVTVAGTLNSRPNKTFRVELFASVAFDSTSSGEGQTFLGSIDVTTDVSGNAGFSANVTLPPGQRYVTATATDLVTGDTSEFSTVNRATTTTLVSSLNPALVGQAVTFTATVTNPQILGSPTGTVTFSDGATAMGTVPLSGGVATFATTSLAAGNHTITARYNGDSTFLVSTKSLTQTIDKVTQTISFDPFEGQTYGAGPIELNATASSGLAVTFLVSGPATFDASSHLLTLTGAGTVTVQMSQAGNGTYAPTSVTQSFDIATKVLTVIVSGGDKSYDATTGAIVDLNLDGVVGSDDVIAVYSVANFNDADAGAGKSIEVSGVGLSGISSGNYTVAPTAITTAEIARKSFSLAVGDASKTYGQAADYSLLPNTIATGVAAEALAISYSSAGEATTAHVGAGFYSITAALFDMEGGGKAVNYAVAVTPGLLAVHRATVAVSIGSLNAIYNGATHATAAVIIGAVNGDALTATVSYDTSDQAAPVHAGTYVATGSFPGDGDYEPATATAAVTIAKANAVIVVNNYFGTYDGLSHKLTGAATGVSGENLAGLLQLGASYSAAGTNIVEWSFDGNGDYNAVSGGAGIVAIDRAVPAFDLDNVAVVYGSGSVILSGAIALGQLVPTGSVIVTIDGMAPTAALIQPDGSFAATFAANLLAAGIHTVDFNYAGDANFTAAEGAGSLTVSYDVRLQFDPTKAKNSGSTVKLELDVIDATGVNVAGNLSVRAISVVGPGPNGQTYSPEGPGSTYQDQLFKRQNGHYVFELKTLKTMPAGVYTMWVQIGADPTLHAVTFMLK